MGEEKVFQFIICWPYEGKANMNLKTAEQRAQLHF